jgi:YVTN family beta-propeller protein
MSSASSRTLAYVGNNIGVSVIDTTIDEVVAKIPLSFAGALAAAPDGKRVYVGGVSTLSVIGTATNTVVASVNVQNPSGNVAVAPDGKHAYFAASLPPPGPTFDETLRVLVLETATESVVASIDAENVGNGSGIAVSPNGERVYIGCKTAVLVLDTTLNKIVAQITPSSPGANELKGLAIAPDGKHAYVTDIFDQLSVLDLTNNSVSSTVKLSANDLRGIAISPNGGFAYVVGSGTISVIETTNHTTTGSISLPSVTLSSIAITPDGKKLYVGGGTDLRIFAVDLAANAVIDTLTLDAGDIAICTIAA